METNVIKNCDCMEGLKNIPSDSVDLIVTSPPYNFGMEYDLYNDEKKWQSYFDWLQTVFSECKRVLCNGGRIFVNVQPMFSEYIPTHHRISQILERLGLLFKAEIIWNKNNWNCKFCSFGSYLSSSSPYMKYKWEFNEVFCKGSLKHKKTKGHEDDITKEEFLSWTVAQWDIAPEKRMKKFGHPAMFPEQLAERAIKLFSFTNDVILDPFSGAGTTCFVANKFNRKFIGFDISRKYCEIAQKRILDYNNKHKSQLEFQF